MKVLNPQISVERLCNLFGNSRQAFYKQQRLEYQSGLKEQLVIDQVRAIRKDLPRLGGRKTLVQLKKRGIQIGRDALFNLLGKHAMLVRRQRSAIKTTRSSHWLRKYPNLIRHFKPRKANQLWVSDITYVRTSEAVSYLFLITDAYSRKIVGYSLADNLKAINAVNALEMALEGLKSTPQGLIHHSDRGIQYCSRKYVQLLKKRQIRISMTETGDPLENAIAERVNGILKDEWLNHWGNLSQNSLQKAIDRVIYLYNYERPHSSIEMLTPNEAHTKKGQLKRLWKNYYKISNAEIILSMDNNQECTRRPFPTI